MTRQRKESIVFSASHLLFVIAAMYGIYEFASSLIFAVKWFVYITGGLICLLEIILLVFLYGKNLPKFKKK